MKHFPVLCRYGVFFLLSLWLGSCTTPSVEVVLDGFPRSRVTDLAAEELTTLFGEALSKENVSGKYRFTLKSDTACKDGAFAYAMTGNNRFTFSGEDPAAVSHAVYSFLEEIGYVFDITGITAPEKFNFSTIEGVDKKITPRVRWRGIRQHVNFPMDISSYPIGEAEEYLRNMVRLRFNKITIHSYPGQWYEVAEADSTEYAGHFFYGDTHYMYDNELLKAKIRFNDSVFCIPEAEAVYNDKKARSTTAVAWMSRLITYAKEIGLRVQFSFEPRNATVERAVAVSKQILSTYPGIDELELIGEETGGWAPACTDKEIDASLRQYFPTELATDPVLKAPVRPTQTDLNQLYTQIGINAAAIKLLEKDPEVTSAVSEIKLGIYCVMPEYSPAGYYLARKSLPETKITLLSSHGSDGVARYFDSIVKNKSDLSKTEIYSWIEFDGLMYLQQNGIAGIETLMEKMERMNEGGQLYSLLFNHWRTAENRTTARYAALSALYGKIPAQQFYETYARQLGIGDTKLFAQALTKINEVDSYATGALGNIGFCWVGAWRNDGYYHRMSFENMKTAEQMYLQAGEMLTKLLASAPTAAGKEYLNLLGTGTLCSIIYINAFYEAAGTRTIKQDSAGNISDAEMKRAAEICNRALLIFDQYLETYAAVLPDRGSEGTLVSVWNGPIRGVKLLRHRLGGVPPEDTPPADIPIDAPPLPIFQETK